MKPVRDDGEWTPPRPPGRGIDPNRLYCRADVEYELDLGVNTLTRWIKDGLEAVGEGARGDLFLGADVIRFAKDRPKRGKVAAREAARKAAETRRRKQPE